jgi:ligand-binding SRPBCC domain-containing protein
VPDITLQTWLPASPERCFWLSLSVDAHTASMSRSGERIVGGVSSGPMGLGDRVTWRARHFGVPFTMTSAITDLVEPARFVDEQQSGPFRRWWHEHRFEADGPGTRMTDVVQFQSPAGVLGRLVDRLLLTRYLTGLLEERNRWLAAALSSGEGQDPGPG